MPLIPINEVPFKHVFHDALNRIGSIYVCGNEQAAWSELLIEDIHQALANTVIEIIKEAGAVDKIELLIWRARFADFFKNLMDRFMNEVKRSWARLLPLNVLKQASGVF